MGSQQNQREGIEIFHVPPAPQHIYTLPLSTSPPALCGPFITTGVLILTHHNHLKSIVYVKVHSWCRAFYGFEKIHNDMNPPFHTEKFTHPETPLCSAFSTPATKSLQTIDYFTVSVVLLFCDVIY